MALGFVVSVSPFIDFRFSLSRTVDDSRISCFSVKGGCNGVSFQNVTYFESPDFPRPSQVDIRTCSLTVLLSRDVKQVLVEFLFFELLPPTEGNCLDDRFVITGQAINYNTPEICGTATGQHSETLFICFDG